MFQRQLCIEIDKEADTNLLWKEWRSGAIASLWSPPCHWGLKTNVADWLKATVAKSVTCSQVLFFTIFRVSPIRMIGNAPLITQIGIGPQNLNTSLLKN